MKYYQLVNRAGIALDKNPTIIDGIRRGYLSAEVAIRECPNQTWITQFTYTQGEPSRSDGDIGWRDASGIWRG